VTLLDQDGDAAEPGGAVTVHVQKADGTDVLAAGTATSSGGTGIRTVGLTAAQTATLELLTATWADAGDSSTHTTYVEIVGGYLFTVAEARASDPTLADPGRYPASLVVAKRREVDEEFSWICDQAFTRRYRRVAVDGSGGRELRLPDNTLRAVRSVRVYDDTRSSYTAFDAGELAELTVHEDRLVERPPGKVFPWGRGNVVVEYEHGWDRPPEELKRAAITRLRYLLNAARSGIPDRATSFTSTEAGTFRLDTARPRRTGFPDIDAVLGRWSKATDDDGKLAAASAQLQYDPSYDSLFHGGRR